MDDIFIGPKLKVKRADQHINELNRILSAFVQTDFCRVSVDKEANTGRNILKFEVTKPLPCEIPLIIGDAVHNLRAALDIMACDIVSIAGGIPSKWTQFPFRDTRQELEATINGGEIKIAGADIIDLILDTIKPYKGGNDPLCALHALDITDKHKLLIPIVSVTELRNVNAIVGGARLINCTFSVGTGGVLNIVTTPGGDIQLENNGTPTFAVFFDKGQIFEGQLVVPTLHQLSQLVSGIVQTIEKAYLTRT